MLTPVAPSTSNINDRLQCRRHLKAEEVMRLIADIYDRPSMDFHNKADRQDNVDVLRAYSECLPRRPPGLGICQSLKFPGSARSQAGVYSRVSELLWASVS
jgi:hypothetical protein